MFHSPVVLGLSGRRPPDDLQHSCESWDAGMNDRPHHVCNAAVMRRKTISDFSFIQKMLSVLLIGSDIQRKKKQLYTYVTFCWKSVKGM